MKIGILVLFVAMIIAAPSFAQKKSATKAGVGKSDTVKLPLSKLNVETLVALQKRANGLREQIVPFQNQLNLIDSTWSAVLKTKLDASNLDPEKGKWGILGMNLIYIPNDSTKKK